MQFDQFVESVAQRGKVPRGLAQALTYASLQTLGQRISGGEAEDLASQLPAELQPSLLEADQAAEDFDAEDFARRVAEQVSVATDTARDGARAVLETLREAVSPGEWDRVTAQLSEDYRALVGPNS